MGIVVIGTVFVDIKGFPKDNYYYYKSWWTDEPVLHIFPHWNHPGKEGQPLTVYCYSNLDEVELFVNGKSYIDPAKCIKCGKCASACPYHAIIHLERPCQAACGMDAIGSDEHGRAVINQDKCVACGACVSICPQNINIPEALADMANILKDIPSWEAICREIRSIPDVESLRQLYETLGVKSRLPDIQVPEDAAA